MKPNESLSRVFSNRRLKFSVLFILSTMNTLWAIDSSTNERWDFNKGEDSWTLEDKELGLVWSIAIDNITRQAKVANSLHEAERICASIRSALPGINAFMEPTTDASGNTVGVSKSVTREYWGEVLSYFSSKFAEGGRSFYTHNQGEFGLFGQSVIIFQPGEYHKWDIYSQRNQNVAQTLCLTRSNLNARTSGGSSSNPQTRTGSTSRVVMSEVNNLPVLSETQPDLASLSDVASFIGPGSEAFPISRGWKALSMLMEKIDVYDSLIETVMPIVCGDDLRRSVLFVGDSAEAGFKYIASRMAVLSKQGECKGFWQAELDSTRLAAGKGIVGDIEATLTSKVIDPASGKNIVLFSPDFLNLLKAGSHRGDLAGIGPNFVNAISSGDLRFVGFISKKGLTDLSSGLHSGASDAFSEIMHLEPLQPSEVIKFVEEGAKLFLKGRTLELKEANYLAETANYFQPNLGEPRRSLKIIESIAKTKKTGPISRAEIMEAISKSAQVPRWIIERNFDLLKKLPENLESQAVGLEKPKQSITKLATKGYYAGRLDDKPVANMLFVGPTGTGKTFLAEKFAELVGLPLITFDMTYYQTTSSFDRFVETLSESLITSPFAVYLFEEIDKADVGVLDRLYLLMDKGVFHDLSQRPLFARGAFVIMTSNAAQNVILKNSEAENLSQLVDESLLQTFRSSFLNRFDSIEVFKPFSPAENDRLASVLLKQAGKKLKKKFDLDLEVDAKTVSFVSLHGRDPLMGARPMERLVFSIVELGLAAFVGAGHEIPSGHKAILSKGDQENQFILSINNIVIRFEVSP